MRKIVRELGVVLALAAIAAAVALALHRAPESLPPVPASEAGRLSLAEFRTYVEEKRGVVLDARPTASYRAGHVPGAFGLAMGAFDSQYAQLQPRLEADRRQPIVVYCSGFFCQAADSVRKNLEALGYAQVAVFPKGWAAWQEAGLPKEKSQ